MARTKTDPRRRRSPQARPKSSQRKPQKSSVPDANTPVLDSAKLKALYAAVLKSRLVGEKLRHLRGDSVSAAGHEATIVGTAMHLLPADFIAPSPSMFLASHIQGTPLEAIFAHLSRPSARPANGESLPNSSGEPLLNLSAATQLSASASAALTFKLQSKRGVVLALVDEDSSAPGFWKDAVGFASGHRLPILFVICTAPSAPVLRDQAQAFALPGITVDGNDVVAVYRVAQEALRRAREGHGPCLIECKIGQTALDSTSTAADPVAFMEGYLQKRKLWSAAWKRALVRQFSQELRGAERSAAAA